eukprot:m.252966 g.252966  ORF g.252966 m.252966 type:complete len:144 (-) comp22668_c1_seq3:53-484(-)
MRVGLSPALHTGQYGQAHRECAHQGKPGAGVDLPLRLLFVGCSILFFSTPFFCFLFVIFHLAPAPQVDGVLLHDSMWEDLLAVQPLETRNFSLQLFAVKQGLQPLLGLCMLDLDTKQATDLTSLPDVFVSFPTCLYPPAAAAA